MPRSRFLRSHNSEKLTARGGGFQVLGDFEQLQDAVPIAGGGGGLQRPVEERRQFRTSGAVGKINVEFASEEVQFLGIGVELEKLSDATSGPSLLHPSEPKAGSPGTPARSGFRQRAPASLTPAKRLKIVGEKHHQEFGGFDATAFREWVAGDDVPKFGGGAQDHGGAEFEFPFDGVFDAGR